jgi:nucleoside diphosphate kinase
LLTSFDGKPFELASLDAVDLSGIGTILTRYRDLGIQLADASLVHLANRDANKAAQRVTGRSGPQIL